MAVAQGVPAEAGIRDFAKAFEKTWNARDAAGVAGMYASDGDIILGDRPRQAGTESIQKLMTELWASMPADRKVGISVASVRPLAPDVAIAECVATFSGADPGQNRATWVVVRREGQWRIAALRTQPAERPAQ
jgi:uncharacterized protein (TIGR02246 family)